MGCHFLLQGIFLTQGLNLGLLHRRQVLYHLSHQGNPMQWALFFFLNELLGGHTSFLVGSQVPNQGLNPGQGSKDLES